MIHGYTYAEANESAIHMIANIAKENNIDCDFTWRPAYLYTQSEQYMKAIEEEARVASSFGIKASCLDELPLPLAIKAALRSQSDDEGELVLVAGENHKTGDGKNLNLHYQNLMDFAHQTFEVRDVKYRWSTQDCMTLDGVPYVGNITPRNPNLYLATGFGKWGMSNGTVSAMILSDLITKGDNPWAPVYNPSRFNLTALKTFVVQGIDYAKELVSGKIAMLPDDIEIANGEARAIEIDGQKCGAYRDKQGELHVVDTTCTHLGCELKWNDAERTWDCPCHGSRFSYTGNIIEGPAFNHLHPPGECQNQVEARIFQ
jgi:Rieske Fe-S protein